MPHQDVVPHQAAHAPEQLLAEELIPFRRSRVAAQPSPELTRVHVEAGIALMRESRWEAAAAHFRDGEAAARAGFTSHTNYRGEIHAPPKSGSEVLYHASNAAGGSWHYPGRLELPWIKRAADFSLANSSAEELAHFNALNREIVFCQAEEWIHGLQEACQSTVSKLGALVPFAHQNEVDAALYLIESGVPPSELFLSRYYRQSWIDRIGSFIDYTPAFRNALARRGESPITVSRAHNADVHIAIEGISREQLVIRRARDGFLLANGKDTAINCCRDAEGRWQRLIEPRVLPPGSAVSMLHLARIEF